MILSDSDLFKIIQERPNKKLVDEIKKYTKKTLMHVKGVKLDDYIERISEFEPKDLIKTRKKYAVSNKDLFGRLLRPLDKIFSAKGGSVYFNLPEDKSKQLREECNNVAFGYSVKRWMETFWLPAVAYDPMGLIFMEVDQSGTKTYPTYKSANDIFDYQPNGRKLEYIIFDQDPRIEKVIKEGGYDKGTVYRVVDDLSDRIVTIGTETIIEINEERFTNWFMEVPAMIISDIFDPTKGFYVSNIDEVIEKADQFLVQGSVKNIFKNYFGFPQFWTYQSACPECMGTKMLGGVPCTFCNSTGLKQRVDPSETIHLPVPQSKDQPILAPEVGGYITPDIEGWDQMDKELKMLEDGMCQTLWGTHQSDKKDNATATGRFIDVQPVNDKLNAYSDSAEVMETFIIDKVGNYMFDNKYKGASVSYGKRYMIETPDEIWKKYEAARKNGAPISALDDLYNDYLQSRYSSNALELQKYLKLARVEPYKHLTLDEVQSAAPEGAIRKMLYSDWISTLSDGDISVNTIQQLQSQFSEYVNANSASIKPAQTQKTPKQNIQPSN